MNGHHPVKAGLIFCGTIIISATIGLYIGTQVVINMAPSITRILLLFAAYNIYLLSFYPLYSIAGISKQTLRLTCIIGSLFWLTQPYISYEAPFLISSIPGTLDHHISLLKNTVMKPQFLTNYSWTYLGVNLFAFFLGLFAIGPTMRGQSGPFFKNGNNNDGSGDRRTTARLADARWATPKEVKDNLSAPGGIVLGEYTNPRSESYGFDPKRPKTWGKQGKGQLITMDPMDGNGHVLVISESSGFKTVGIVISNQAIYDGPITSLDPKLNLHDRVKDARKSKGFRSIVVEKDNGLDPMLILRSLMKEHESVFFHLAENLIPATPNMSDEAQFFRSRGIDLLSGLFYHFVNEGSDDVLAEISFLLSLPLEELVQKAVEIGKASKYEHVKQPFLRLQAVDKRSYESLGRVITNKFKFAEYPDARSYIIQPKDSEKHLEVLKPDVDVYLNIPSRILNSFNPMVRILLASMLTATQLKEKPGSPSARRLLILDEAKGLGNMDVLNLIRDEGRDVGLHLMMIYQSWGQMTEIWGDAGARAWEDSVSARILGATQDDRRAKAIQEVIGKDTLTVTSKSNNRRIKDFDITGDNTSGYSEQMREAPLITTAEIATLPRHGSLILTRLCRPILASKAVYFTRRDMKDKILD